MKSSIIIPVHNQVEYTRLCIESIIKNSNDTDYEIIVINNGSTDATEHYLKEVNVKVIYNKENIGVAKAWNQGIKISNGSYIFIINNDIVVCKNWIRNLIEFYENNPNTGIVSPAIREGKLNYDFEMYSSKFINKMKKIKEEGIFACCMVIKKDRFEKVGLFSEEFEIGIGEDTDFYLKLKNFGYKSYITGCAFVHHFGSITLNDIKKRNGNNFEIININKLYEKWNIKKDSYFKRKAKSFKKFIKNLITRIFYGYTLYSKSKN
ncbi:MAG: glycosyltransferase family 2 protein [Candidatus Goldbacteria bacterium]|nr:glycosyltransferase family 2 protein [Candidatus Goldiibacteriota bacterium]